MSTTFEAANIVEAVIAPEVAGVPETVAKDAAAIVGLEVSGEYAALFTGPVVDALPGKTLGTVSSSMGSEGRFSPYLGPVISVVK